MYTSGTTGHPKGAKINHKMQLFNAVNLSGIANLTSRTKQLVILPLFHTGGINCYANPVLHQGGEIIIMREFDPTFALKANTPFNSPLYKDIIIKTCPSIV